MSDSCVGRASMSSTIHSQHNYLHNLVYRRLLLWPGLDAVIKPPTAGTCVVDHAHIPRTTTQESVVDGSSLTVVAR